MSISSKITVKFFARLREQVGHAEVSLDQASDVLSAWNQATDNMPMPDNTLCAINMEYVDSQSPVTAGDEVAFFPPVTGGSHSDRHSNSHGGSNGL